VVPRASCPFFMFCAPELVFDGTECVGTRFHVLRALTHFWLYRGRQVLFSCFALPDSFSAILRASSPVLMYCGSGLIFYGTEGIRSRFHVLLARIHFRQYRGRHVPISCFARPFSFSAVPRALGPVFMFCSPGLIFSSTEGVGCRFNVLTVRTHFRRYPGVGSRLDVLRARTHFRRYRGRRLPFSFSAVARALGSFFMFCATGLVFDGTEDVGSRFQVLR
jgi:hypothetical protein